MNKLRQLRRFLGAVLALVLVLDIASAVVPAGAATSVRTVIANAAGTDGGVVQKSKDDVIDRYALKESFVQSVSAGWNDKKGTAVVVVCCQKNAQAKKVKKKFDKYLQQLKDNEIRYGVAGSDPYLASAKTGKVGKYAILVMVSEKSANNKKGLNAAIHALK